ncbi:hypothetical protein AMJ80_07700 [bacterium SM23_31]|nr:MAG: hypothetical protein AMJ80_07700 [bacterium SM23_31]
MIKARWFYTYKGTFKGLLFVIAMLIIAAQVWYTQSIVKQLREDQREIVEMSASMYSFVAESDSTADYNMLLDKVIKRINIPVILTTPDGEPQAHEIKGISETILPFLPETVEKLKNIMAAMDKENPPIPIMYESMVLNYLHYSDSEMIRLLNWLPFIEISMVGLFILLGFIGFNSIRKSEQRFIWVGIAKETAHQLGTPISSLIGWIEMLKESEQPDKTVEIIKEMDSDTSRLTKVAQRFSQIGADSELANHDIVLVLKEVAQYFRKRLPQLDKSVTIHEEYPEEASCQINRDLFEWAIENLIKNGLDAIENGPGKITIKFQKQSNGRWYTVDISDTGKGMTKQQQKQIFKPGFTTKMRGWGLGLNLSKRIIEDYHKGRLLLKSTKLNEGTTMRIMLKRST